MSKKLNRRSRKRRIERRNRLNKLNVQLESNHEHDGQHEHGLGCGGHGKNKKTADRPTKLAEYNGIG